MLKLLVLNSMQDQIDKVYAYGNKHNDQINVVVGIAEAITKLQTYTCNFCNGSGHTARTCASKKTVDRVCKAVPQWKVVWGSIKGKEKSVLGKRKAS